MLLVALGALVVGSLITASPTTSGCSSPAAAIQGCPAAAIPLGISLLPTVMPRERVGSASP